jgi:hypothetical protein
MQDGFDLITALAVHPETGRRLARKFWNFFISEIQPPDPSFVEAVAGVYRQNGTEIRPVVRYILNSVWFNDPSARYARYSWPAEFVVRSIKEVGWQNYSLDNARSPMAAMGQQLFEPPNVGGWPLGANWFSTSTMLARTNFAAALAGNQKAFLAATLAADAGTADGLISTMLNRRSIRRLNRRWRRTSPPQAPGPATAISSAHGRQAWRAFSSALPNISWCRGTSTNGDLSTSVHSQRRRNGDRGARRTLLPEPHRGSAGRGDAKSRRRVPRRRQ